MMSKAKTDFFENLNEITSVATEKKVPGSGASNFYKPDEENKQQENKAEADTKPDQPGSENKTDETFDPVKSGRNTAIVVAGSLESVFILAERLMWAYGRFTFEEKETINRIQDLDPEAVKKLTDREKEINRKFLRLHKKHEDLQDKLEFSPEEKDAMAEGFAEYSRQTGKSMSPKVLPWVIVGKALVGKATDIFL